MFKNSMIVISAAIALTACGGSSSGGGDTTATGQFKDSNTAGLQYVSGNQTGITGADGSFTYETGSTVTFSIGGVTLGTSDGKSVITPIDLVSGGSSSSVQVQNIVRFLMMLDDDGNPSNGINISTSVQTAAESWPQVDFNTVDLPTELMSMISDAASADGGLHTLPNASTAQAHIESTLLCSYAGAYKGTYSGGDSGNFGFLVDASNGNVTGVSYSIPFLQYTALTGITPISFDQNVSFVSGNTSTGASFSGQFTSVNALSGTWQNSPLNGSFSGTRIGGAANAAYRFTGTYIGGDLGLFSFDVGNSNSVTGVAYSVAGDELLTLSGSVSGTSLTATASNGTVIAGTLNTSTGALAGTWNNSAASLSGSFSGSGCALN